MILGTTLTCLGLGLFLPYFFPDTWNQDRFFFIACYSALSVMLFLGIGYGFLNISKSGTFYCRLSAEILECHCPVTGCGDSFVVRVDDIVQVEQEGWHDSYRWFVRDSSGHRYWLTSNYDNPADEVIETIKGLRPSVAHIDT